MRNIPLEKVPYASITPPEGQEAALFDYRNAIKQRAMTPLKKKESNYEDMRRAVRILDKINGSNGDATLMLEEDEWEYLTEALQEPGYWAIYDPVIVRLIEAVVNAERAT